MSLATSSLEPAAAAYLAKGDFYVCMLPGAQPGADLSWRTLLVEEMQYLCGLHEVNPAAALQRMALAMHTLFTKMPPDQTLHSLRHLAGVAFSFEQALATTLVLTRTTISCGPAGPIFIVCDVGGNFELPETLETQ